MTSRSRIIAAVALGLLLLAGQGCGGYDEGTVAVSGKLTNGGQALTGTGQMNTTNYKGYQLVFLRENNGKYQMYASAFVDESGNFSVELLPGKYKVAVGHSVGSPMPMPKVKGRDLDLSKFQGEKTPIEVEISGSTTLDIDISKY